MKFKDGDKCFELRFDASSFAAYLTKLGFDFTFKNGEVEFPDCNVLDAIISGVGVFGIYGNENPDKNLVFLMTYYLNQLEAFEERIKQVASMGLRVGSMDNDRGSMHSPWNH